MTTRHTVAELAGRLEVAEVDILDLRADLALIGDDLNPPGPVPSQVRSPYRATLRTAVQLLAGVLPMLPLIVDASGVDGTAGPVAGALGISLAATRVMALPQVESLLQRVAPWLAAQPPD